MSGVQIIGRSSSHFTRLARLFACEFSVPVEFVPIYDMTSVDTAVYAGNPALKLPTMRRGDALLFGAENICRALSELSHTQLQVVWPEQLREDLTRNAQELVWHGMAAQVQLAFGTIIAKLPADNLYFVKGREGFLGALRWLEENLARVLRALPETRDLSVLEAALFCLIDHITFRATLPLTPYPALVQFTQEFATRPSAQQTVYQFDAPPNT
jgi:glutathione S-transferase